MITYRRGKAIEQDIGKHEMAIQYYQNLLRNNLMTPLQRQNCEKAIENLAANKAILQHILMDKLI